ncbi:15391_t:CDS:1, partial [Racocetra persica]
EKEDKGKNQEENIERVEPESPVPTINEENRAQAEEISNSPGKDKKISIIDN